MNRMAATGMFLVLVLLGTLQDGRSFAADSVKDGASGDNTPQAMEEEKAGEKMGNAEIKYALTLEKKFSKEQILEGYLNIAAFGPSTYRVEASAQHYFSHSAAELFIPEAEIGRAHV